MGRITGLSLPMILYRLILIILFTEITHGYDTYYMDEFDRIDYDLTHPWGKKDNANSAVVLKATSSNENPEPGRYKLTFSPVSHTPYALIGTVSYINLRQVESTITSVRYDRQNLIFSGCQSNSFSFEADRDSSNGSLFFDLDIADSSKIFKGFHITVTIYNPNCDSDSVPDYEFECSPKKCIDKTLVCDGTDNCGNNADEKDKIYCLTGVKKSLMIFLICLVLLIVLYCYMRYRKKRELPYIPRWMKCSNCRNRRESPPSQTETSFTQPNRAIIVPRQEIRTAIPPPQPRRTEVPPPQPPRTEVPPPQETFGFQIIPPSVRIEINQVMITTSYQDAQTEPRQALPTAPPQAPPMEFPAQPPVSPEYFHDPPPSYDTVVNR